MKAFATEDIRNLAVIGHGDAGKTQLVSSLLHVAGTSNRWGKVDEGTTVTDYEEDSIERKISLNNNFAHLEYNDTKINLIDTPGYAAFVSHARPALRVADCALVVVDGVHGIEVQTEKTWQYANEFLLPRFMVINKLDKEHSDFGHALDTAAQSFARSIVPFTLPIGNEANFKGVVDVVHQKAYEFDEQGKAKGIAIPSEGKALLDSTRERLIELVAESDDALMEKYFADGTLPEEDIYPNLAKAIAKSRLCPVYAVSATTLAGLSIGIDDLIIPEKKGQLVQDARRHGVDVRPADALLSRWDCTLEEGAVRLGLRMVGGLAAAAGARIAASRPCASVEELAARAGLHRGAEELRLRAVVVDVELAMDVVPAEGQQARDGVAVGRVARAADVDRTGRVGADELDVDPQRRVRAAPAPARPGGQDRAQRELARADRVVGQVVGGQRVVQHLVRVHRVGRELGGVHGRAELAEDRGLEAVELVGVQVGHHRARVDDQRRARRGQRLEAAAGAHVAASDVEGRVRRGRAEADVSAAALDVELARQRVEHAERGDRARIGEDAQGHGRGLADLLVPRGQEAAQQRLEFGAARLARRVGPPARAPPRR